MNDIGAYDDIDMRGLRPSWYESHVDADAQKRLIAAFPELRVIWNLKIGRFQLVYRQPGWNEPYYGSDGDGFMVGWSLIPGDEVPPLQIEAVIAKCRAREALAIENAKRFGCENPAQQADMLYDELVAAATRAEAEQYNDMLGLDVENRCMKSGVVHLNNMLTAKGTMIPRTPQYLRGASTMPATGSQQRKARRAAELARRG